MKKWIALSLVVCLLTALNGCKSKPSKQYDRELPPGQLALRKITNPDDIPDFTAACNNTFNLINAIDNSLEYLAKPSSEQFYPYGGISHTKVVASLNEFKNLINSGITGPQLNQAIRQKFDVYISVGCDDAGTVLFTGYYTPIFNGSLTPTARFRFPLYKQPDDLVKGPDGTIMGQKMATGQIMPYPNRRQIEASKMLTGKELIYLEDEFEVYIAHVQGSAKIRLPDGKLVTVGYSANNGKDYKSIGKQLIADGRITQEELSLATLIRFFKTNPNLVKQYTSLNPRFVFFQFDEGEPKGSLNVPVIPMRSIATDKSIFPRGALTLLVTNVPRDYGRIVKKPYSGFALDQDTGGAIRAPGRCDIYMGVGDKAGQLAGQTYEEGQLYYLFLK